MSFWQLDTWKKLFGGTPTGATPNATGDLSQQVRFIADQFPIGGSLIHYQIFTASGTWTKPAGAKTVVVSLWGAGGGGGSGYAQSNFSSNAAAPAGGQGGHFMRLVLPAYFLPASVTVVVGAGGTGGGAVVANSTFTNGVTGSQGGKSDFHIWTTSSSAGGTGGSASDVPRAMALPGRFHQTTSTTDMAFFRVEAVARMPNPPSVGNQLFAGAGCNGMAAWNSPANGSDGADSAFGGGGGGQSGRAFGAVTSGSGGLGLTLYHSSNGDHITANRAAAGSPGSNGHGTAGQSATLPGCGGGAGGVAYSVNGFGYTAGGGGNGNLFGGGGAGGSSYAQTGGTAFSGAGGNGGNGLVIVETYG